MWKKMVDWGKIEAIHIKNPLHSESAMQRRKMDCDSF